MREERQARSLDFGNRKLGGHPYDTIHWPIMRICTLRGQSDVIEARQQMISLARALERGR